MKTEEDTKKEPEIKGFGKIEWDIEKNELFPCKNCPCIKCFNKLKEMMESEKELAENLSNMIIRK